MDSRLTASWSSTHSRTPSDEPNYRQSIDGSIQWKNCGRIGSVIYPSDAAFGHPTVLECTTEILAVGTTGCCVLLFNYYQDLLRSLRPPNLTRGVYGPVTALAISKDNTFVAAGFEQGYIVVWKQGDVFMHINPLNRPPASYDAGHETHLVGSAVISVKFVPGRHSLLISADNRGIVVMHHAMRLLLEHRTRSHRLLGTYLQPKPTTLFAMDVFEVAGTSFLAALSPFNLCILTLDPKKVVLHIPRSAEDVCLKTGASGFLTWNDHTKQLIWGWSDLIILMKAVVSPNGVNFAAESQYRCFETLVHLSWLDEQFPMVIGCTVTQKLVLLRLDILGLTYAQDITGKHALHQDFFSHAVSIVADLYPSIRTMNGNIFLLGKYEFLHGSLINWADRLMSLLASSDSSADAVALAARFYQDDSAVLGLIGLPTDPSLRKETIKQALPDIVLSAVRFAVSHGSGDIPHLLGVCVRAIILVDITLLGQIFDVVQSDKEALDAYLNTLTDLVLDGIIHSLPPRIFQELLLIHEDSHELERVLYRLDPSTLDFDLAMSICQKRELCGPYIYLCICLGDFHSPITSPTKYTMAFIAYTLTGKVFPTGSLLSSANEAKRQVWSDILRYTKLLLDYDASGLFSALNEGFEDDFLNEDDEISRQIVVNTLLNVYTKEKFENRTFLNIFLGRQLPKYPQYLLLPGSRIQKIIEELCLPDQGFHDERELAILCLLSIYKPSDLNELIARLSDGGFWLAIEQIYRSKQNWNGLALLQLKSPDVSWKILHEAVAHGQKRVFKDYFSFFAQKNPNETAKIANEFGISVWDECLKLEDPLPYLKAYFSICSTLPPMRIRTIYISMLSRNHDELMFALEKQFNHRGDIDIEENTKSLLENDATDAVALLLCRDERYEEALTSVIKTLDKPGYCDLATTICSESRDLNLWKRLIDKLMEMDNFEEVRRVVQVLVESDELVIELVPHQTQVIQDVLILMRRQSAFLSTILSLLNGDLYGLFTWKLRTRLQGWSVAIDCDCECCGSKVCGVGVDANILYDLWMKNKKDLEIPSKFVSTYSLAVFQCGHTYHSKCLERISPNKTCPVCTN